MQATGSVRMVTCVTPPRAGRASRKVPRGRRVGPSPPAAHLAQKGCGTIDQTQREVERAATTDNTLAQAILTSSQHIK